MEDLFCCVLQKVPLEVSISYYIRETTAVAKLKNREHARTHVRHLSFRAICIVSPFRPTQLSGRQPPAVARAGGADVLLVAPDRRAHHALPAQPGLPDGSDLWRQQQLSSEKCIGV